MHIHPTGIIDHGRHHVLYSEAPDRRRMSVRNEK